jgi:hypothetical protein
MVSKERCMKKLKPGKLSGRSTMNNMDKHKTVKAVRKESRRMCSNPA